MHKPHKPVCLHLSLGSLVCIMLMGDWKGMTNTSMECFTTTRSISVEVLKRGALLLAIFIAGYTSDACVCLHPEKHYVFIFLPLSFTYCCESGLFLNK